MESQKQSPKATSDHGSTTTDVDSGANRLRTNLQTLSQEIYDMIYIEVFTAAPGMRDVTRIHDPDGAHKYRHALKLLRVSPHSRALYAKSYYGPGAHFIFAHTSTVNYRTTFKTWLKSLPLSGLHIPDRITTLEKKLDTKFTICFRIGGGLPPRVSSAASLTDWPLYVLGPALLQTLGGNVDCQFVAQMSVGEQAELKELGVDCD